MPRLYSIPVAEATGDAAELFAAIQRKIGSVPNAYRDMGVNSPAALRAVLDVDALLHESSLSARDIEVIKLAVSETVDCGYCVAAHSLIGKGAGLSAGSLAALRNGAPTGDARHDVLAEFARYLVTTRGTVPVERLQAVKAAGISDAQIVDTILAIGSITFTNLFNRVNDTTLDFPRVA